MVDRIVIEIIYKALKMESTVEADSSYNETDADNVLKRNGIKADKDYIYISNSHEGIKKILSDSSWGIKWSDILRRISGSITKDSCRFGHMRTRAIGIPTDTVFEVLKE